MPRDTRGLIGRKHGNAFSVAWILPKEVPIGSNFSFLSLGPIGTGERLIEVRDLSETVYFRCETASAKALKVVPFMLHSEIEKSSRFLGPVAQSG